MMRQLLVTSGTCIALALSATTAMAETVVGGKNYTEQLIMSSMTNQLLEAHGYDTDLRNGMGSTVLRKAQVNGQVDLYWEYTGTSLVTYNEKESKGLGKAETIEKVRELDREKGLVWLECSDANNTYALAVREGDERLDDVQTLGDLAGAYRDGQNYTMALDAEFSHRPDGLPGLEKAYDFRVPRSARKLMEIGLAYNALNEEEVDVAMVFSTDGRISALDFRVLDDNRQFFPDYSMCPVVRKDSLEANPELRGLLEDLAAKLDDSTMRSLNEQVDVDEMDSEDVARQFLKKHDMI
jgi:osmoprotectant transport system substrate-binding protein